MMEPHILTTTSTIIEEKHMKKDISLIPTLNRLDSHSFYVVLFILGSFQFTSKDSVQLNMIFSNVCGVVIIPAGTLGSTMVCGSNHQVESPAVSLIITNPTDQLSSYLSNCECNIYS